MMSCSLSAEAASPKKTVEQGNEFYAKEDYISSIAEYSTALEKDPESDIINFNLGTAYYKNQDYDKAISHFQKALLTDDEEFKKKVYYNLGNALYKSGASIEKEDTQTAMEILEQSLMQYQNVLDLNTEDEDSKYNFDFV